MRKYIKLFEAHSQYESYTADTANFIKPNISFCLDTPNDVHYNPYVVVTGVTLNKSELSLNKGETETLVATVLPSNASDKSVTWSSSDSNVATVDDNGLVTAVGSGNATITVTTVDGGYTAQCAFNIIEPHDYVEIGGLKWATMNIGASSITDSGMYFSFGDTQGYTSAQVGSGSGKKYFGWTDYKYCSGAGTSNSGMTKYNATDGLTTLEAADDAARAAWGGSWRTPTLAEWQELSNAVNTARTQVNGVYGVMCTDKQDSTKQLFFPAVGRCYKGTVGEVGTFGFHWSSTLNPPNWHRAYGMGFSDRAVYWSNDGDRCDGRVVRAVLGN